MFSSFFANKKWAAWAYFGLAVLLISTYAQVQMIVLLNNWYKDFYDILQNVKDHTIEDFWTCVLRFAKIAFPYVLLATMTNYFTRLWTFKWREAMTFDYIKYWRNVKTDIEGSSQRIQEDIYRFAKVVENLGSQVADAVMTLIAFIPILWALSGQVDIPVLGKSEGSLVWIALTVSIGGLAISWFVGIKLPGLEYNNQKVEAAFRKELVYAEDDKANYGAPEKLEGLFQGLKRNYYRLFLHYGYFDIWRYMFGQSMVIVPLIAMGPSVLAGTITLGVMMQVVNAFSQVRGSLAVFMNNWTVITELRSIHKRLKEFEKNIEYKRIKLDENLQSEPV
ncbi:putative transporter [Campylobacter showae]|jgi:transmembrane transport protein|uniref:putative transporter n=1 Tax=Campylobacter showae TaxID=204 RepID=UPI000F08172E|nr:putative transporter [Campylobacter showae]